MEPEFILPEFWTSEFHLRPDGLISLLGVIVPQSCRLSNSKVADALVDKEPGVGGLFTLTVPQGRFEARYAEGQWRVRTDIPKVLEALAQKGAPQTQEASVPNAPPRPAQGVAFPMPEPFPTAKPPTLYGAIAVLAVLGVVAVLGYYTFEEPIHRMFDAHAARQEARVHEAAARLLDAQRKEAYRTLEKTVREAGSSVAEKITRLEKASQVVAIKIQESTGILLAALEAQPAETPHEVDQLLRKNEAFLCAWNQLLNAYASDRRIAALREELQILHVHDEAGALQEEDRDEAERLGATLDARLQAIETVSDSLAIVQETLASNRLQEKMSQQTRSSP